jgi:hypothetical protein
MAVKITKEFKPTVLVSADHLHPSTLFGASLEPNQVDLKMLGSNLGHKYWTRVELGGSDKCTSLQFCFISYGN